MALLAPNEVAGACAGVSEKKADLSIGKTIILGILAGVYIGFGANLALTVGSDAAKIAGSGIGQFLFGGVFAVGLMLVVIGGAELFTGNNMFMVVGALDGTVGWGDVAKNWTLVWIANFIGSLLLVYIILGAFYFGVNDPKSLFLSGAVGTKALAVAKGKVGLTWSAAFLRGILCNWLVCLAVWLALASKDVGGKVWAIWFPIMAFVASGFEHSVANMFFVPLGIELSHLEAVVKAAATSGLTADQLKDAAQVQTAIDTFKQGLGNLTWSGFFLKNLIPVTLGNIVGGGFFVGSLYWYAYLKKSEAAK